MPELPVRGLVIAVSPLYFTSIRFLSFVCYGWEGSDAVYHAHCFYFFSLRVVNHCGSHGICQGVVFRLIFTHSHRTHHQTNIIIFYHYFATHLPSTRLLSATSLSFCFNYYHQHQHRFICQFSFDLSQMFVNLHNFGWISSMSFLKWKGFHLCFRCFLNDFLLSVWLALRHCEQEHDSDIISEFHAYNHRVNEYSNICPATDCFPDTQVDFGRSTRKLKTRGWIHKKFPLHQRILNCFATRLSF